MTEDAPKGGQKAPPYTAFQSVKTLIATFKSHGLPARVDRTVLGNFSGAVGSQLLTALRFLALIDDDNHPRNALAELVDAYGTDVWPSRLEGILRHAYQGLFALDLTKASPGQFGEAFRKAYSGAEGDTLRKAMTFFLNAAREAKIPVSPYITKNTKPRIVPTKRKTNNSGSGKPAAKGESQHENPRPKGEEAPPPSFEQMLVDLLDPATMTDEETKAVWTLLLYLKKQTAQAA